MIYHQTMIGSQWISTSKNIAKKLTYWLDNDNEHTNKICQWVCWPVWQLTVCPAACLEVGLHLPWLADSSHFAWNICAVKIKPKASKSLEVSITVYDHQETVVLVEWWSLGHLHCRNILNIITTWLAHAGKTGKHSQHWLNLSHQSPHFSDTPHLGLKLAQNRESQTPKRGANVVLGQGFYLVLHWNDRIINGEAFKKEYVV